MPAQTPPFVDRRWTSPEGLNLHARDYAPAAGPARPPVVAVHGLTRNSADFEAIAPLLAQSGRRVLAVDVRGRGLSDRAPDPMTYTPDVYARDILALMDQAAIDRAVFVGTSMGGLITMALTTMRPKAVVAAILNDIGPEVAPEGLARDIAGSQLLWIGNLGHKPDYVVTDVIVAAVETLSGKSRDLRAAVRFAEERLNDGKAP